MDLSPDLELPAKRKPPEADPRLAAYALAEAETLAPKSSGGLKDPSRKRFRGVWVRLPPEQA